MRKLCLSHSETPSLIHCARDSVVKIVFFKTILIRFSFLIKTELGIIQQSLAAFKNKNAHIIFLTLKFLRKNKNIIYVCYRHARLLKDKQNEMD